MPFSALFGRAPSASDREGYHTAKYRKAPCLFLKPHSWCAHYSMMDTIVCLCVGRKAIYMFDRKSNLKLLQALPNIATDEPDHNNQTWADRIGGDVVGEIEPPRSLVQPWEEPAFGIKFRYRHTPQISTSSAGSITLPSSSCFTGSSYSSKSSFDSSTSNLGSTAIGSHQAHGPVQHGMCSTTQTPHREVSGFSGSSQYPVMLGNNYLSHPFSTPKNPAPASSSIPPRVVRTRNGRPPVTIEVIVRKMDETQTTRAIPNMNIAERPEELGLPVIPRRDVLARFKRTPSDTSNVESYVSFPQFSQIWDLPQYHVKSMDPKDPMARLIRENGLSSKTSLRPNFGKYHDIRQSENEAITRWWAGSEARARKRQAAMETGNKIAAHGDATDNIPAQNDAANNIQIQKDAVSYIPVHRAAARRVTFETEPTNTSVQPTRAPPPRNAMPARPSIGRKNSSGRKAINATAARYQAQMADEANAAFEEAQAEKAQAEKTQSVATQPENSQKAAAAKEQINPQQSPPDSAQVEQARNVYGPSRNPVAAARQAEMARRANAAYEQSQAANGRPIAPAMQRTKARRRSPIIPARPKDKPKEAPKEAPKEDPKEDPKEESKELFNEAPKALPRDIPKWKSTKPTPEQISRQVKGARPIRPRNPTHEQLIAYQRAEARYLHGPSPPKKQIPEDVFRAFIVPFGDDEYRRMSQGPERGKN